MNFPRRFTDLISPPMMGFFALRNDGPVFRLVARGCRIFIVAIFFFGSHGANSLRTVSTSGSSGTFV